LYREFESLLHRHILKTQTPDFPRESRGFVVFGVQKMSPWDHHGTGALFWCAKLRDIHRKRFVLLSAVLTIGHHSKGAGQMANHFGVTCLIQEAKDAKGTPAYPYTLEALGEAGGSDAVTFLIQALDGMDRQGDMYKTAVNALGRASRN
jgi:hypothetical protein